MQPQRSFSLLFPIGFEGPDWLIFVRNCLFERSAAFLSPSLQLFFQYIPTAMERISASTAHTLDHTVTIAATTFYRTLIHTAPGPTKTTTLVPSSTAVPTSAVPQQLDPMAQVAQIVSPWPQCIVSQLSLMWQRRELIEVTATCCLRRHCCKWLRSKRGMHLYVEV